jgi:hypothetical protein
MRANRMAARLFLQKPLYIFGNGNPLEYGDLFCFALLAITAINVQFPHAGRFTVLAVPVWEERGLPSVQAGLRLKFSD